MAEHTLLHSPVTPQRRYTLPMLGMVSIPLLAALCMWALSVGPVELGIGQVISALCHPLGIATPWEHTQQDSFVVLSLRLPRLLLALAVGGSLGVAGACLQGLFRNPLADPALIGVSGGAAFGAIGTIVLSASLFPVLSASIRPFLLPLMAFAGGFATTMLAYSMATRYGRTFVGLLLLAGIAINAITGALSGLFMFFASDAELRSITFWSMGSVSNATWSTLAITLPAVVLPALLLLRYGRFLNALALGEQEAYYLGVRVQPLKLAIILLAALAVGAGVASCGIIGFIGLVVPHLLRITAGPDYRFLLPASFLVGGLLLAAADTVARTAISPAELPIGIITTGIGGPFFLWLLLRQRKEEQPW